MNRRWHLPAVALVAFATGLLFLQVPGFGDDLTYWSFAFDLHERGLIAWQRGSFHDLRWPVWGVCWVLQGIFGPGLASYYGVPLLYLTGGAVLAFVFARRLTDSIGAGWAAGIGFTLHPLLDTVCYRPMPDLSEGVWGAAIMLCWWELMQAKARGPALAFAALTGVGIFIIEANRVTGAFIVPVLVLATLLYFPRRFGWLLAAGAVAAALYLGESAFYKWLFNDWLHDIHANSGNQGAKGTEFPNPWGLPFRFLDTLWKGNPLAPAYCIAAAVGIWAAWRRRGLLGRSVVLWFAALYLLYACAPQSLWPWRPLVRDADRFLAALAIPMSVLAAAGLWQIGAWLWKRHSSAEWANHLVRFERQRFAPALIGVIVIAVFTAVTSRTFFDMGFVKDMRRYLAALPDGTKVFSHKAMREIVHLVDAPDARRVTWLAPNEILHADPKLEEMAAQCSEFWYVRKLIWLTTRKQLERGRIPEQPPLGSYLAAPEREWRLTGLFAKGDTPDLIFYRRLAQNSPPAQILDATAPEFGGILPALPASWTRDGGKTTYEVQWKVPRELRGRLARFEFDAASAHVEACTFRLRFMDAAGRELGSEFLLKPYLYRNGGREFFALPIPAEAESCAAQLKFAKDTKRVDFRSFRAVIEPSAQE